MKRILTVCLCLFFALGLLGVADAQKRGGSRSSSSKSSSSRSKSTSGTVSVKGYYRKDGTYVKPHYRSAPDGNFSNNWSTRGNVNPFTGKVGTKDFPYGGWIGSDRYSVYNTPFDGISADFEGQGLRIRSSSVKGIVSGSTITHYKRSSRSQYIPITSWRALSAEALECTDREWWLQGKGPDGRNFATSVKLLRADSWSGTEEHTEGLPGEYILQGVVPDLTAASARVLAADARGNLSAGYTITGVRRLDQSEYTEVKNWLQVHDLIREWRVAALVARGTNGRGGSFNLLVHALDFGPGDSNGDGVEIDRRDGTSTDSPALEGLTPDPTSTQARIGVVQGDSGCEAGWIIDGVRKFGEQTMLPVTDWPSLWSAIQRLATNKIVISGTKPNGGRFEAMVKVKF